MAADTTRPTSRDDRGPRRTADASAGRQSNAMLRAGSPDPVNLIANGLPPGHRLVRTAYDNSVEISVQRKEKGQYSVRRTTPTPTPGNGRHAGRRVSLPPE